MDIRRAIFRDEPEGSTPEGITTQKISCHLPDEGGPVISPVLASLDRPAFMISEETVVVRIHHASALH